MNEIMLKSFGPALLAMAAAFAVGPVFIPLLQKLKFGQVIRGEGPEWHMKKSGTPTMGGFIFWTGLLVGALAFANLADPTVWMALVAFFGFGLIGFADDFIKVKLKRNLGLKAWQKFLLQAALAAWITVFSARHNGTAIRVPFMEELWEIGWWYYPLAMFAIVGLNNGTNLIDGLDGLCASNAAVYFAAFGLIFASGFIPGGDQQGILCCAMVGALIGFLRYNTYPARTFMGDTGSLSIGGLAAYVALMAKMPLFILIMGGMFLSTTLSVMLQVGYFKLTHGKRLFRMAPLHHHFELLGLPETRIVTMYTLITTALCMVGLLVLR